MAIIQNAWEYCFENIQVIAPDSERLEYAETDALKITSWTIVSVYLRKK